MRGKRGSETSIRCEVPAVRDSPHSLWSKESESRVLTLATLYTVLLGSGPSPDLFRSLLSRFNRSSLKKKTGSGEVEAWETCCNDCGE